MTKIFIILVLLLSFFTFDFAYSYFEAGIIDIYGFSNLFFITPGSLPYFPDDTTVFKNSLRITIMPSLF